MTDYVVLASQRTGSSWLMDILNQQWNSEAFGELFLCSPRVQPEIVSNAFPRFIEWKQTPKTKRSAFNYCDELFSRSASIGFKLMYSQLKQHPKLLLYLKLRNLKIVHLVRSNDLDVLISLERMRMTGVAHLRTGESAEYPKPIRLDTKLLINNIRKRRYNRNLIRFILNTLRISHIEIEYEDLLKNEETWKSILAFLKIEPSNTKPTPQTVKGEKLPRSVSIKNAREVYTKLQEAGLDYLY